MTEVEMEALQKEGYKALVKTEKKRKASGKLRPITPKEELSKKAKKPKKPKSFEDISVPTPVLKSKPEPHPRAIADPEPVPAEAPNFPAEETEMVIEEEPLPEVDEETMEILRDKAMEVVQQTADEAAAAAEGPHHRRPPLPRDGGYLLHAWRATFAHPTTGESVSFCAPPPPELCTQEEMAAVAV